MFGHHVPDSLRLWHLITRLGEAQVLLPLAFVTALSRARRPETRPQSLRWIGLLGIAVLLTTATKVAFIGWGIGSADLDFTGVSGHTMLAAGVYPVLLPALAGGAPRLVRRCAVITGCVIALLVGVSRFVLGAHSVSEIVAGWLAGGVVSFAVLRTGTPEPGRVRVAIPAAVALWLLLMPATVAAVDTHALVTRLALALSGHERPYTRRALLRDLRRGRRDTWTSRSIAVFGAARMRLTMSAPQPGASGKDPARQQYGAPKGQS